MVIIRASLSFALRTALVLILAVLCLSAVFLLDLSCPESPDPEKDKQYRVPLVPYLPCMAMLLNYLMIGQLSTTGVFSILAYIGAVLILYIIISFRSKNIELFGSGMLAPNRRVYEHVLNEEDDGIGISRGNSEEAEATKL